MLDLDYAEDSEAETDMNVVMNDAKGFIEVQGTAEGHALQRSELDVLLDLAAVGIEQLARRAGCRSREVTLPAHWVLATGNRGKVAELSALLAEAGLDLRVTAQSELGVDAPPETGTTFVENALLKARHAARVTGLPAIADDSGLVVDALGGAPGVRSARFAGEQADDGANIAKLLAAARAAVARPQRAAFTACSSRSSIPTIAAPLIAAGSWAGEIARAPQGARRLRLRPRVLRSAAAAARQPSSSRQKRTALVTVARRYGGSIELLKNR